MTEAQATAPEGSGALHIGSLQKLCRVWGYVKYTHPAFLFGQKDWDTELLALIPDIRAAQSQTKANDILYHWFNSLGPIDYSSTFIDKAWTDAPEQSKLMLADVSWISDQNDLGEQLSAALSRLKEVPVTNRAKAAVQFDGVGGCVFTNEKTYAHIDYSDVSYRLLGLFRLWNALEYYYPYRDILDRDWRMPLRELIPAMLNGDSEASYDRMLAMLLAELHDAHAATSSLDALLLVETGSYAAPVHIAKADGVLVVERVAEEGGDGCPLMPGDVLLRLNGVTMDAVIDRLKQIVSLPDNDKLLNQLGVWLLRSPQREMEITVRRNNTEQSFVVKGVYEGFFSSWSPAEGSHRLLDNNIGLINPSGLAKGELAQLMEKFSDTRGLIVDLRQYPKSYPGQRLDSALADYLLDTPTPFVMWSYPSKTVPGAFLLRTPERSGGGLSSYRYPAPVVLLMNEQTQSHAEYCVMALRTGRNVVVMGENSIGADGNVAYLPLPDGDLASFTGLGIYTPDGGQTQRVGLSPDIDAHRTILGVREGRDELMEAAIRYLLEH